ncbi:MAG: filamentous hemagglutinin N-terminal domain-containing protein, partial [Chthoniobacterales bacterium]
MQKPITLIRKFRAPRRALLWWVVLFALGNFSTLRSGDILRGGISVSASRKNAEARALAGQEAASLVRSNAQDRLARTTQAMTAMRALQQSARSAVSVDVPNGLQLGGLQVATGPNARWDGANAPDASGSNVTIKQTSEQAILHWDSFNIGRGTTLTYDQSAGGDNAGKWVAFNKVFDPSGVPSRILGSIKAEGQVYVLNQNGIIFSAGSQVNVRTLVASSLPINDNLVNRGLLNNPDAQFLFSGLS